MHKQCGKIVQDSYADIVFLNTFGLTLESVDDVTQSSKIKVFDKDNVAGYLYFDNDKVIIDATYNNGDVLKASYNMPERDNDKISGKCHTKIDFQVKKNNSMKLSGKLMISSLITHDHYTQCSCASLIEYKIPGKEKAILKMNQGLTSFCFESNYSNRNERIHIEYIGDFLHDIKSGECVDTYHYRKFAVVNLLGEELHSFLCEEKNGKKLKFVNNFSPANTNNQYSFLQKGMMMGELDPSMYKKVKEIRKKLLIGNTSLLDNLVSVCYDHFSDEEVKASLGIERKSLNHQEDVHNIGNCSFLGDKNKLTTRDSSKQLVKKQGKNGSN